jgi:hypothetical protein
MKIDQDKANGLLVWCKEHCSSAIFHNVSAETGRELDNLQDALGQLSALVNPLKKKASVNPRPKADGGNHV